MSDYMTIYLAGAMTGKTLEEMNKWRKEVTRAIELSPDFRRMVRVINPVLYYSTADDPQKYDDDKEYIRWEWREAENADVVISACDTKTNSIGTAIETHSRRTCRLCCILLIRTDMYVMCILIYTIWLINCFIITR